MKRRLKGKILAVLTGLTALLLLAGCSMKQSLQDIVDQNDLTARVTYYANGGFFEDKTSEKNMYFQDESKAFDIGNEKVSLVSGSIGIEREGYEFTGWYYAQKDAQGNIVYQDDQNRYVQLGEAVDFTKKLQDDDHWFVYAGWSKIVEIKVQLVCADDARLSVGDKEYKDGDVIRSYGFGNKTAVQKPSRENPPVKVDENAYTFLEFYEDEALTTLQSWPIEKTAETTEDIVIYAHYIEGNWKVLKDADDVKNMFNNVALPAKYYLFNDIDCAGTELPRINSFNIELQGNGHKLSNITVANNKNSAVGRGDNNTISVFGKLGEKAKMENVTFENLQATFYTYPEGTASVYLFYTSKATGSVLSGVSVSGKLTVEVPAKGTSLVNYTDDTTSTNWLFGGQTADTDETGVTSTATFEIKRES